MKITLPPLGGFVLRFFGHGIHPFKNLEAASLEKLAMFYTESPKINYDAKFDVLYCSVGDNSNSRSVEDFGDIEVFRDFDTDEITGYTVFNFKTICKEKSSEYEMLSRLFDIQALMKNCGFHFR